MVGWGIGWKILRSNLSNRYSVVPRMVGVLCVISDTVQSTARERFSCRISHQIQRPWRGRLDHMSRNPFLYDRDAGRSRDESSEFGFGPGMFPDPTIDYSAGGAKSGVPIADPDSDDQLLTLAMIKRTDVSNPNDVPSPYVAGNTDRYGAAPPLVREKRTPPDGPRPRYARTRMERQW